MPVTIETQREFIERNGNDAIPIDKGARLLFGNGATIDGMTGQTRTEPPTDPVKKLKLRQLYIQTKLNHAEKTFYNLRKSLLEQGNYALRSPHLPPPDPRAIEQLDRLRNEVADHAIELEDIAKELSQTPEAIKAREHAEWEAKRKAEVQEQIDRINSMTLDGETSSAT